jgi:hypothetical protein
MEPARGEAWREEPVSFISILIFEVRVREAAVSRDNIRIVDEGLLIWLTDHLDLELLRFFFKGRDIGRLSMLDREIWWLRY